MGHVTSVFLNHVTLIHGLRSGVIGKSDLARAHCRPFDMRYSLCDLVSFGQIFLGADLDYFENLARQCSETGKIKSIFQLATLYLQRYAQQICNDRKRMSYPIW